MKPTVLAGLGLGLLVLCMGSEWSWLGGSAFAATPAFEAANPPPPAAGALGYPSRAPDLDILPGFKAPPPGYGEVPYWWWTGDRLEKDRLLWQLDELHRKGIAGIQVNYAHEDTEGWPTYPSDPPIFSEEWWDVWKFVAGECDKRSMGIGLSGYTLDWPNGRSLVSRTIYSDPEIAGRELAVASRTRVEAGKHLSMDLPQGTLSVRAYPWEAGRVSTAGEDLSPSARAGRLEWTPTAGEWEVWVYTAVTKPGTLNPMHPESGARVIEKFFQPFQDHAPNRSSKGLNYFFQDELQFGVEDHVWTVDFARQFRLRKGYDVFEALPALFADIGPRTPKARLDYLDVRMQLVQERYFEPIFRWHWDRGLVYGCDAGSRGRDPIEFGDYFSAVRWYTAPGHDTPGGHADLIKGKVSSSIAHLYRRPRVWLEGYHSLGWGAAPERLMQATCENYLYGCNLLNLHGFYYSTHGSFWEWAPPCYHFRMPYWEHMGTFLKYFERLSYVLSQGVHQCDIAVLYPVTPGQAGLGGKEAAETAWEVGTRLFQSGRDFIFMDDDSLARATLEAGRLRVSDASYRVLVLPGMRAIRWETLQKVRSFQDAGGVVLAVGGLPEASNHAGREDAELDALVREVFGATAAEARGESPIPDHAKAGGGLGAVLRTGKSLEAELAKVLRIVPPDVSADPPIQAQHRKIGARDVYWVVGAPKGKAVTFRARGRAEWWDPWTGEVRPIRTASGTEHGTRVLLPSGAPEAQLIVFSPGETGTGVVSSDLEEVTGLRRRDGRFEVEGFAKAAGPKSAIVEDEGRRIELHGEAAATVTVGLEGDWEFELRPTMDNRWGDYRLPVVDRMIGPEARIFRYSDETRPDPGWQAAEFDDSKWERVTHGFGPQFRKATVTNAGAVAVVDPTSVFGESKGQWPVSTYSFSWRWGKEGDPGHQGWHGLKENVTDEFLCLGKPTGGQNETLYREEAPGTRYYLQSSVSAEAGARVRADIGGLSPSSVWLNGKQVRAGEAWELTAGANELLLEYKGPGRGHFVVRREGLATSTNRTPLAMKWYDDPSVMPFDVRPKEARPAGWYRFTAPPGLKAMVLRARGEVQAWVNGKPCRVSALPGQGDPREGRSFRVEAATVEPREARVALRIQQERGYYAGAAIPDPIRLECAPGGRLAGDWSEGSVLENYSGGAVYRRNLILDSLPTGGRVQLDLGDVVATAEVSVNGKPAGVRVSPPWVFDITSSVKPGDNQLEVVVYNTLANHYLTIPTRFRGSLKSGLVGPVRATVQAPVVLASP